jgi:hypothetical protein
MRAEPANSRQYPSHNKRTGNHITEPDRDLGKPVLRATPPQGECPKPEDCEDYWSGSHGVTVQSGQIYCDEATCTATYILDGGPECQWFDTGGPCAVQIFCDGGHWVLRIEDAGGQGASCYFAVRAQPQQGPAGIYPYDDVNSDCDTCPENMEVS